jgi:PAS domain S-box-containing protein
MSAKNRQLRPPKNPSGTSVKKPQPNAVPAVSGAPDQGSGPVALRQKAEAEARITAQQNAEQSEPLSAEAMRIVLHELRVNQIELEMQNDDLRRAHIELARSEERYFDLYNHAPVAYCTINEHGLIVEANLTFATMLGINRGALVKQPFSRFVSREDADRFTLLRRHAQGQTAASRERCELRIMRKQNPPSWFWAELHVTVVPGLDQAKNLRIIVTDITRRKQAEAALQEHDAFNASVLDSVADHIAVLDPEAVILFVNRAWRRFFEENSRPQPAVDPVGQNYLHVCMDTLNDPNGAEAKAVLAGLQAVLSGTQLFFQLEYPRHSPMQRRWFLMTVTRLVGARPGVVVSHKDITARNLAAEAQRETEERFQTLVKNLHVGILLQGPGSEVLLANPRALELLGLTEDQVLGRTSFDPAWNVIHEDGSPFPSRTHPAAQAIATGRPARDVVMGVYRPMTKDRVWLRVDAEPQLTSDGNVVQVVCTFQDITARRGTETALKLSDFSVRQASLATLWIAPDARIHRVNSAACELLGYTEAELLTLAMTDLDADSPAERWPSQWQELRDRRRMSFEARHRHKSGRLIAVAVEFNWFEFEGQEYNFAFVRDLSATRALEEQLRQSQKLEAIGTLAGGIAHDFNNILAGIYGFTSLAQHAARGNAELQKYLKEISRAGRRAADLVRQILAFSRTSRDGETLTPVQVGHIVTETVKLLRACSPSTIQIVKYVAPNLPLVRGNASQLHQVIMNLGMNALHAMGERPGCLTLRLEAVAVDESLAKQLPGLQGGSCVRLSVSDTGKGIDLATQQRVFEPFFTTKDPGEGTGLGLSVVHGIVRSHQGAIRLASEVGRGTTFEIFLRVAAERPAPTPEQPAAGPYGHGERILFVDDEETIAKVGQLTLQQFGYAAEGVSDVLQALARLEKDPQAFDLVISDQTMPGITGLEFAERIRKLRDDLPVVLASGHSTALTPERIRTAGVCEVLAKPYSIEALALAVRRNLPSPVAAAERMQPGRAGVKAASLNGSFTPRVKIVSPEPHGSQQGEPPTINRRPRRAWQAEESYTSNARQ